ncbi:hypothetical protein [Phycicoccus sp. Root101]|uniref:hypothetical protein n=1 Tax=Phycicoccus sp. Root101 TaxID=1736421 RepID=UPI000702659E|nr:hypothetical protein [Phycicoccus sp. Root101]KQU65156.1 hypothetical protein ASC58_16685 [Phycicoccus sp. Root101]
MRPVRPILALSAVTLLGACGTGAGTTGGTGATTGGGTTGSSTSGGATPPTSDTTTSPDPENPSVPARPGSKVRLVTVTGSVSDGVEAGCLLLTPIPTDPNGPWLLIGKVAGIAAGQQVTVRGYRVEDMASTCQQGRPFRVEAVVTG